MYKVVKEGKGNIVARIVADSKNTNGGRITTFELEYHRYIHSEVMTHRLFSRNAMSSRAVPVKKMIEQVENSPATPIHWGAAQSGMQAAAECNNDINHYSTGGRNEGEYAPQEYWELLAGTMASCAGEMLSAGYHKQIVNRILEPFQMMKVVLTATEFDNFFWLRCDKDAQPEIQELAGLMYQAMEESNPELLKAGEWHTPYVDHERREGELYYIVDEDYRHVTQEEAIAISSSCCAQVSYRNIDNSFDKAMNVYERLGIGGEGKVHASPFEHTATPMKFYTGLDVAHNKLKVGDDINQDTELWETGITHLDREDNFWSGNFKGFVQHRQLLENHTCYKYEKQ